LSPHSWHIGRGRRGQCNGPKRGGLSQHGAFVVQGNGPKHDPSSSSELSSSLTSGAAWWLACSSSKSESSTSGAGCSSLSELSESLTSAAACSSLSELSESLSESRASAVGAAVGAAVFPAVGAAVGALVLPAVTRAVTSTGRKLVKRRAKAEGRSGGVATLGVAPVRRPVASRHSAEPRPQQCQCLRRLGTSLTTSGSQKSGTASSSSCATKSSGQPGSAALGTAGRCLCRRGCAGAVAVQAGLTAATPARAYRNAPSGPSLARSFSAAVGLRSQRLGLREGPALAEAAERLRVPARKAP